MKQNSKQDNVLYVKMLDGFSMIYQGVELVDGRQSSSQFCGLMEAVLYYRRSGVGRSILKETLFEGREMDDPSHAIRNIIYNAKKRMRAEGMPDAAYIEIRKGLYFWTDEVPVLLDTEEMIWQRDLADEEEDPDKKLGLYLEAVHLYRSAFLGGTGTAPWMRQEERIYRDTFRECVESAAKILRAKKDYKQLRALSEYAVSVDPFSDWEVLTVEALAEMGRYEEAQALCEETIEKYITEFGQRTSSYVRELSNRLSSCLIHQYEGVDEIQDKLDEDEKKERGGFFCSYPAFQEVYRILSRTMDRQKDRLFLMLCTVVDSKGNPMRESAKLDELSERLSESIIRSVRHSDTVTRYGKGQYLVLLVNTSLENCSVVQRRIDRNFLTGRQRTGIEYSVRSIIVDPGFVAE